MSQARLGYLSCLSNALTFIFGIGRFRELVKVHSRSAHRITINGFIPSRRLEKDVILLATIYSSPIRATA